MIIFIIFLLAIIAALMVILVLFTGNSKKYVIYNKETNETITTIYIQANHIEIRGARNIGIRQEE